MLHKAHLPLTRQPLALQPQYPVLKLQWREWIACQRPRYAEQKNRFLISWPCCIDEANFESCSSSARVKMHKLKAKVNRVFWAVFALWGLNLILEIEVLALVTG